MENLNWETDKTEFAFDLKIFKANWVVRRNPKTGKSAKFVVLDSKNWVNIIPITNDRKVVMIEQYRHGIDRITLEVPGGLIDESEKPEEAAIRECVEETGFFSENKPIPIGMNHPNPAFLNNSCFSYVWYDVEKKFEPCFDPNEDIVVKLVPIENVLNLIRTGEITHSIVLNAFFFLFLKESRIWGKLLQ